MTTSYIHVPKPSITRENPLSIELGKPVYYYHSEEVGLVYDEDPNWYDASINDIVIGGVKDEETVYFAIQWEDPSEEVLGLDRPNYWFDVAAGASIQNRTSYPTNPSLIDAIGHSVMSISNIRQTGGTDMQAYSEAYAAVRNEDTYTTSPQTIPAFITTDWVKGPDWEAQPYLAFPASTTFYNNVAKTNIVGSGTGLVIDLELDPNTGHDPYQLDGAIVYFNIAAANANHGTGYAVNDVIKIAGSAFGRTDVVNDLYVKVTGISNAIPGQPGAVTGLELITDGSYGNFTYGGVNFSSNAYLYLVSEDAIRRYYSYQRGPISSINPNDPNSVPSGGFGLDLHSINNTKQYFIMWFGPGKYIKDLAKNIKLYQSLVGRGNSALEKSRPLAIKFKVCLRTEYFDTVYSNESLCWDARFGLLDIAGRDWEYDNGKLANDQLTLSTKGVVDQVTYPYVSQIDLTYNEETLQGIVETKSDFGFIYQGRRIRYPSNATGTVIPTSGPPLTGTTLLSGGALSLSNTEIYGNNPAIASIDFVTNKRYGLGNSGVDFDKFSVDAYYAAQRCDELVFTGEKDDGGTGAWGTPVLNGSGVITNVTLGAGGSGYINPKVRVNSINGLGASVVALVTNGIITGFTVQSGGTGYDADDVSVAVYDDIPKGTGNPIEMPRYTLNVLIDNQKTRLENLNDILSNFDARYYWHNGYIRLYQDAPRGYSAVVNQTSATNIKYSGSDAKALLNTCYVKFNNRKKLFAQDTSFAEDRENLLPGIPTISKEIIAVGVTNPGQAARMGRLIIENEKVSDQLVTYTAGADHTFLKPGDLVLFSDSTNEPTRKSGKIVSISNTGLMQIDETFQFVGGKNYYLYCCKPAAPGSGTIPTMYTFTITNPGTNTKSFQIGGTGYNTAGQYVAGYNYMICEQASQYDYTNTPVYEIMSIKESDEYRYEVMIRKFKTDKFANVDLGYVSSFQYNANFPDSYVEDTN